MSRERLALGRLAILASLAFFAPACADTAAQTARQDLDVASRAADELEAQRGYAAALLQVESVLALSPPEAQAALRLRRCALRDLQGDLDGAGECYAALFAEEGDAESAALAGLRLAELRQRQGQAERASTVYRRILNERRPTDAARRALAALSVSAQRRGGVSAELELLEQLLADQAATIDPSDAERRLFAGACVRAAEIAGLELADPGRAIDLLAACASNTADTVWHDDAEFLRARLLVQRRELRVALTHLDELIDARTSSWFVGSYDSIYFDDALLLRAQTLEALGDYDEALAAYDDLAEEAPTSRLVDDARFAAASLRLTVRGDPQGLEAFVRDFPDSRHRRAAEAVLGRDQP